MKRERSGTGEEKQREEEKERKEGAERREVS